ncbi:hypothetical protein M011DRAFT_459505 [Sporormia fimetaria CBS 119925]|uniref:Uncharacterized protein n=1 Tax=Sporormia fimetaria CBS 119925 TaxID=1340428 RepID=A0A6A6V793_9PLEO|nr:hypothetical protein M011DRAFT_459505 [Sporormia fimetaria CBS 119925]
MRPFITLLFSSAALSNAFFLNPGHRDHEARVPPPEMLSDYPVYPIDPTGTDAEVPPLPTGTGLEGDIPLPTGTGGIPFPTGVIPTGVFPTGVNPTGGLKGASTFVTWTRPSVPTGMPLPPQNPTEEEWKAWWKDYLKWAKKFVWGFMGGRAGEYEHD